MNVKFMTIAGVVSLSMIFSAGCATKKYVRNETAPIIDKTNELDELTSNNTRQIKDVDARAQKGIQQVQAKATEADQKALAAGQSADQAQSLANQASTRVISLTNVVANLDNYQPVVETTVHFGFDKANLSRKAKAALDQLGQEISNTKHYILVVDGNTDSTGPKDYNYRLSQRRASNVIRYLASKYDVPAHKFYFIGLGKDDPVASNSSVTGRARNRRVEVKLMTNRVEENATSASNATSSSSPR